MDRPASASFTSGEPNNSDQVGIDTGRLMTPVVSFAALGADCGIPILMSSRDPYILSLSDVFFGSSGRASELSAAPGATLQGNVVKRVAQRLLGATSPLSLSVPMSDTGWS